LLASSQACHQQVTEKLDFQTISTCPDSLACRLTCPDGLAWR